MKIKKSALLVIMALFTAAVIGCGSESGISVSSEEPTSITGKTIVDLPYVSAVSTEASDPYDADPLKHRFTITFSADMDPATITSENIYIRDITAAIVTVPSTLVFEPSSRKAYLYYTLTAAAFTDNKREIFVSRNVRDLMGNGITPYKGLTSITAYQDVNSDFCRVICAGLGFTTPPTPDYRPLYVSDFTVTTGDTTATVTLILSRAVTKTTLATTNFTLTGGGQIDNTAANIYYDGTASNLNTNVYASTISFDVTGLAVNSVYSVTFNPANVTIEPTYNQYPVLSTSVFTETNLNFRDRRSYENIAYSDAAAADITDFVKKFVTTYTTVTPALVTVSTPGFTTNQGTKKTITFSAPIDPATVTTANFIAYSISGGVYYPIEVSVIPVYDAVDDVYSVEVSTVSFGSTSIYRMMITNSVKSKVGIAIDGNADGNLLGTSDIDGDNVVDDDNWRSW